MASQGSVGGSARSRRSVDGEVPDRQQSRQRVNAVDKGKKKMRNDPPLTIVDPELVPMPSTEEVGTSVRRPPPRPHLTAQIVVDIHSYNVMDGYQDRYGRLIVGAVGDQLIPDNAVGHIRAVIEEMYRTPVLTYSEIKKASDPTDRVAWMNAFKVG